jgi:FMN phosphatase YigB (HAD superfamily)
MMMVASNNQITLPLEAARTAILPMRSSPHREVPAALNTLKKAGFRMVTLTNSSQAAADAQIENAGLGEMFEAKLSVESFRLFKPHRQVYNWAATRMGVSVTARRSTVSTGPATRDCRAWPGRRSKTPGCDGLIRAFLAATDF